MIVIGLFLGCSSDKPDTVVGKRSEALLTVPLADGSAYVWQVNYEVEDDAVVGESGRELWYLTGTRMIRVEVDCTSPEIFPLADGSAVMHENGKYWRLEGSRAIPITTNGTAGGGEASLQGHFFAQWYRAQQDKEGLTERDRQEHFDELEQDQDPPEMF